MHHDFWKPRVKQQVKTKIILSESFNLTMYFSMSVFKKKK